MDLDVSLVLFLLLFAKLILKLPLLSAGCYKLVSAVEGANQSVALFYLKMMLLETNYDNKFLVFVNFFSVIFINFLELLICALSYKFFYN